MADDEQILDKLNAALFGPTNPDDDLEPGLPDPLIAQLATTLQHMGNRLTTLENSRSGDVETRPLAQLVGIVEDLQGRVDSYEDRLKVLENQPWKSWPAPNPVLASWVEEWLIPTFQLETTLTDWQETPALLSELSALFGGYQMMVDPKANGWDALNWHQHRASVIARIEDHQRRHRTNPASLGNWGQRSGG